MGAELETGLATQPVLTCPMVAVLSDGHPAAKGQAAGGEGLDIHALAGDVLVVPSPGNFPGYLERLEQICAATGFRPASLLPVEGADNVLRMVAAGCGVAVLPEVAVRLPVAMCVTRKLLPPVLPFELELLWQTDASTDMIQRFLMIARRHVDDVRGS